VNMSVDQELDTFTHADDQIMVDDCGDPACVLNGTTCHSSAKPQVPYELPMNVYQRKFKGYTVDTYDITDLYNVTNPAAAHALKKILVTGGRSGNKTRKQDYLEAIKSIYRAIELEEL
jgi:hypothetical protein